MKKIGRLTILAFISIAFSFHPEIYADLDRQKEALSVIADFADRICNKVTTSGDSKNLELSGSGKVELNNLLKIIADLGIEGGVKYQKMEYNNVLQKDLAHLLTESSKCKLDVFKELKDKLLDTTATTQDDKSSVNQVTTGDKSPAVSNVKGNVTIEIIDKDDNKNNRGKP